MSRKGAKKLAEDNRRRILLLRVMILVANGVQLYVRFWLRFSSLTLGNFGMLLFTTVVYLFTYSEISVAGKSYYDEWGVLMDPGMDLNSGGWLSWCHDILYITAAAQLLSVITVYAWWLLYLVPLYGLFQLWLYVIKPYFFPPRVPEMRETEEEKKKREKMERKQARQEKFVNRR